MKKELLIGLLLLGCGGVPVEVRQDVKTNYIDNVFEIQTVLWVPGNSLEKGLVPYKVLSCAITDPCKIDSVKASHMQKIDSDYKKALKLFECRCNE